MLLEILLLTRPPILRRHSNKLKCTRNTCFRRSFFVFCLKFHYCRKYNTARFHRFYSLNSDKFFFSLFGQLFEFKLITEQTANFVSTCSQTY